MVHLAYDLFHFPDCCVYDLLFSILPSLSTEFYGTRKKNSSLFDCCWCSEFAHRKKTTAYWSGISYRIEHFMSHSFSIWFVKSGELKSYLSGEYSNKKTLWTEIFSTLPPLTLVRVRVCIVLTFEHERNWKIRINFLSLQEYAFEKFRWSPITFYDYWTLCGVEFHFISRIASTNSSLSSINFTNQWNKINTSDLSMWFRVWFLFICLFVISSVSSWILIFTQIINVPVVTNYRFVMFLLSFLRLFVCVIHSYLRISYNFTKLFVVLLNGVVLKIYYCL